MDLSLIQLVYLYQVFLILFLLSAEVPFNYDKYTHGKSDGFLCQCAFGELSELQFLDYDIQYIVNCIQSDSSLFLIIHFMHSLYES